MHDVISDVVTIVCSPNEDFGRPSKHSETYFQTAVGNSPPFLTNLPFHDFPKTVNHDSWLKYLGNLCSPNEDFGKRNMMSGVSFRGTLRGCEYSICATTPRKMPRKDTPDPLFRFPKSSFGRHKIVKRQVCQNGGELPTAALNGIDLDVIASSNVYSDTRITCLKYHFESLLYALA
jgi:hypothetical protein